MIGVVLAGLFFALVAQLGRMNRALQYHNEQAALAHEARMRTGLPPSPLELRHSAMAGQYRASFERIDIAAFLALVTFAALAAVVALGRLLDWSARRLGLSTEEVRTDSQAITHRIPHLSSEEPRS